MYIQNTDTGVSFKYIISAFAVFFIYLVFMIDFFYIFCFNPEIGFLNSVIQIYQKYCFDELELEGLLFIVIFNLMPIMIISGIFYSFSERNRKILMHKTLPYKVKSIKLYYDKVFFNFFRPELNKHYDYSEIENLEMVINTKFVSSKSGLHSVVSDITLNFKIYDGRSFSITTFSDCLSFFLSSIIEYSRKMRNFSYRFSGAGEPDRLREEIEAYLYKDSKAFVLQYERIKLGCMIFAYICTLSLVVFAYFCFFHSLK